MPIIIWKEQYRCGSACVCHAEIAGFQALCERRMRNFFSRPSKFETAYLSWLAWLRKRRCHLTNTERDVREPLRTTSFLSLITLRVPISERNPKLSRTSDVALGLILFPVLPQVVGMLAGLWLLLILLLFYQLARTESNGMWFWGRGFTVASSFMIFPANTVMMSKEFTYLAYSTITIPAAS